VTNQRPITSETRWQRRFRCFLAGCVITSMLTACEATSMDQAVGIGDANPVETPPPATPVPTLPPTPAPPPKTRPPVRALTNNIKFDELRARGIAELYDGETDAALKSFQEAQKLKPNDKVIKLWIQTIDVRTDTYRLEILKKKIEELSQDKRYVLFSPSPSVEALPSVLFPSLPPPSVKSYRVPAILPSPDGEP